MRVIERSLRASHTGLRICSTSRARGLDTAKAELKHGGRKLSFDLGYAALSELIAEIDPTPGVQEGRNEAQTRFDIIDRIVKEVLHWPVDKIRVEKSSDSGFTDYELVETGTLAILEAKREGIGFTLPLDLPAGVCAIDPLVSNPKSQGLRDAMLQAMRYASVRGTATCIVSNGNQWVAFLGSRNDGIPPLSGKALVFPSLEAILQNFLPFYNCLSQPGLLARRVFSELSVGVSAPPPPLSAALSGYPGTKRRNTVQSNLQIMGQVMLEDIPQEEKYSELFLRECYATSGALSAYAEVSKELLKSRNAEVLGDLGVIERPAALKKGVNPDLSKEALAAAASHRPIVLLGGVGVGKSTFLQHLIAVDAKVVFEDAIAIMVDYGRGATFEAPAEFALDRIQRALRDEYAIDIEESKFVNDLYRKDLERFDKGIFGALRDAAPNEYLLKRVELLDALVKNKGEHLRRSVARIATSRRRQVVIFLDNVDQRDHDDQNRVFLTANEIASSWEATVFVTLRPETYYESLRYGAVSGYHPRVFSISPPRSDVMLKKRVEFALQILSSNTDVRTASGVGIESESLTLFLRVLLRNFTNNRPLQSLIDNVAGGNMRRALDFVTQFIGSGHVDTEKIIGVEARNPGDYLIPLHEFLRSLMHGDNEYFDPQTSPIANLFAIDRPEGRNHFLLPLALDYIHSRGDATDSSGYVELEDVYASLQGRGFALEAVTFALGHLGRYRLIEAPLDDFDPLVSSRARVTTVGAYTLSTLPSLFTYNDAVIVDTPIIQSGYRHRVGEVRNLSERIARVDLFRRYLDGCWVDSGLDEGGWSWRKTSAELERDLRRVADRAGVDFASLTA